MTLLGTIMYVWSYSHTFNTHLIQVAFHYYNPHSHYVPSAKDILIAVAKSGQ